MTALIWIGCDVSTKQLSAKYHVHMSLKRRGSQRSIRSKEEQVEASAVKVLINTSKIWRSESILHLLWEKWEKAVMKLRTLSELRRRLTITTMTPDGTITGPTFSFLPTWFLAPMSSITSDANSIIVTSFVHSLSIYLFNRNVLFDSECLLWKKWSSLLVVYPSFLFFVIGSFRILWFALCGLLIFCFCNWVFVLISSVSFCFWRFVWFFGCLCCWDTGFVLLLFVIGACIFFVPSDFECWSACSYELLWWVWVCFYCWIWFFFSQLVAE